MNNKGFMAVVIVLLVGIFAFVAIEATEKSPSEKVADSISGTVEEVGDNIEDATDN